MKTISSKNNYLILIIFFLIFLSFINFISANTYINDIYFTIPETVYITNERIELKGYVYQTNYSDNGTIVTNSSAIANALVNLTITYSNGSRFSNYTFTTDANGTFYSGSNFYSSAKNITAPSNAGYYYVRAEYKNPNNSTPFSQVEINVINQTLDLLRISSEKANYNANEIVNIDVEAIKLIDDKILYISNVSVNGSLRNATKYNLQNFNCTTGVNGRCSLSITAPSTYGNYILEIGNFKAFGAFSVTPFSYNVYMKDELAKSLKNVFAQGEQARVEVKINNASSSDSYTFSGYIADSSGNSVSSITSTILNSTNSFTNSFLFDVSARVFNYGTYSTYVTVSKTGDGSITSIASFEVQDWMLSINKKSTSSGFENEYNAFLNKTLNFEAFPSYRSNGSLITNISGNSFTIILKDSLNNVISTTNASWNSTCGKSGCYDFSITSPLNTGKYNLYTTLSYNGDVQTETRIINIINGIMSSQSTDKDGNVKELFGANEYAYFSFSAYNLTTSAFNLTDSEVFIVSYMNGTEYSYTQVNNFSAVNSSNSAYEWAWNSSLQRIKMDFPNYGGVYDVYFFGNNRTLGASAKFIVNPYEICSVPKDTAGTVSSGYYYVWQFKTSDTIYFEIKLTQANNPLGKASALNLSGNTSTYGMGSACIIDTTIKQVVSNATLSVLEVKNMESGAVQNVNLTASFCQATDTNGTYTCTVKPSSKWDGGQNIVKFNIKGQDGTTSTGYGRFEARAFYLYGWTSTWQNSPSDNISLSIRLYEAGSSWWSTSGASNGIAGTVSLKRVEYQGSDGEWIWPPVDSGYNSTNVSSATITSGTGTINLPVSLTKNGRWKTGNYRAVLQATTSSGDSDYGYAWFGIKLWDVYGTPVECLSTGCSYKNYFNSKENITMYIKISKASSYSYGYSGGENIWGNVTIGVKKIQDCRKWPCKDLNSTQYSASTIIVNASSPWYWNSVVSLNSSYLIYINTTPTSPTWGTGYYNVVLNVNGTDTGYAWFNTIAFYIDSQPVNSTGNYKYTIRGNNQMYFNITAARNYKEGYWHNNSFYRYNQSDYVNVTLDSAVLRTWDQITYRQKELNYPADINITSANISGTGRINITYNNGTWPAGYYYGEITFKNSANETSTGWLWFSVQPFRADIYSNSYTLDSDQCINSTLRIYDSDWSSWSPLYGNYSIISVYENIWSNSGAYTTTYYTNYTNSSFNATANISFCPNNGQWSSGSWGGYHSLNVLVKDNILNDTQTGWLSFRTIPFQITWLGSVGNKLNTDNINIMVNVTKPSSGANATGNLTKLYQWRYDNFMSTKEEYVFKVVSNGITCYSNVSGQCTVNGTGNVTIYAPSIGWRIGYNYISSEWAKNTDASSTVQDWSGIYFEGRAAYNGWFDNVDATGNYKYYFAVNDSLTIRLNLKNNNNDNANGITISKVEYAFSGNDCWSEYCRSYTTVSTSSWSLVGGGTVTDANGRAIINIPAPSTNWSRGYYAVRVTSGGVVITGGTVRVKDFTAVNITINSPVHNATYNTSLLFNTTTNRNVQCSFSVVSYDDFYRWYCNGWNSTNNNNNLSSELVRSCNTSYNYNGSNYYNEWVGSNSHSIYDGQNSSYCYVSSGNYCYGQDSARTTEYLSTGGLTHSITLNILNITAQSYALTTWCYDDDYNYASNYKAFRINNTGV